MADENKPESVTVDNPGSGTQTDTPKANEGGTVKKEEFKAPSVKDREQEHSELTQLVSQYEEMGEKIATPITVDPQSVKINPFDDTDEQKEAEHNQQIEFEWTKHYMDQQYLSASSALRINSVATLGSQVKMNYSVLMPVQYQLDQAQKHYEYLNDQVNNSRELAQIAFRQQQAQAVVGVQQLNQKLQLELNESRQNMENQVTSMLNVYNQYESSLNDLVLTKKSLQNQQKIIDNKKQNSHKSWWQGLMQAAPIIMMAAFAGGKGLGLAGKIGGIGGKLAETAKVAEGEAMTAKQGLASVGAAALKGGGVSKTIAGLIGGAISLGMFFK